MISDEDVTAVRRLSGDMWSVNLVSVGTLAWLAYDSIITSVDELRLIWPSRWSMTKVLYLLLRYLTLISLSANVYVNINYGLSPRLYVPRNCVVDASHLPDSCNAWLWYITVAGATLTSALGSVILVLRLYALYDQNWRVLALCVTLLTADMAVLLVAACFDVLHTRAVTSESELHVLLPGCFYTGQGFTRLQTVPSLTESVVHAIFFALTLRKFMANVRHRLHLRHMAPMLNLFMRDSAMYFLALLANALFFLVFYIKEGNVQRQVQLLGMPLVMANNAIVATRLVLNLRREAARPFRINNGEEDVTVELSRIEFKAPCTRHSGILGTEAPHGGELPCDNNFLQQEHHDLDNSM